MVAASVIYITEARREQLSLIPLDFLIFHLADLFDCKVGFESKGRLGKFGGPIDKCQRNRSAPWLL